MRKRKEKQKRSNLKCAKKDIAISLNSDNLLRIKVNFVEKIKCSKSLYKFRSFFKYKLILFENINLLKNKNKKIKNVFYLKEQIHLTNKRKNKKKLKNKILLLISGSIIGFLNGFFGGGGGMICVPILQKVLSLDAKMSHATAIAIIFPLSLISASIYVFNGYIKTLPLLSVGLGVVTGGILGAFALKFLPPKAVRIIFAIIMFVGGIKLII